MPGAAGIGAANGAIATMVPTLARELQPLRVNAVAPGVIDTPWWDWCSPEQKSALFADFAARGVSLEARLDTLEPRGDAVVASGTVRMHRPDGLQEAQYHWVFHFAGGRLRRLSIYAGRDEAISSLAALNALAPPPAEFEVQTGRDPGGALTLRPTGELDIASAPRLERALREGRRPGEEVVLDLAGLEFIDSTGLRVVVRGVEAAAIEGWELRLRHGPPAVRRVFEIAGVLGALPFETP